MKILLIVQNSRSFNDIPFFRDKTVSWYLDGKIQAKSYWEMRIWKYDYVDFFYNFFLPIKDYQDSDAKIRFHLFGIE